MEIIHSTFVIIISLFVSWIWVDYYRLIDIYDKKKFQYILFTFILGFCFAYLMDVLHELLTREHGFNRDGNWWEVGCYAFLQVGLPEEIVKVIPFIITIHLFPKVFNEPIDYLGFATFSALGFAAAENIRYIDHYGEGVALSRAIIAVLSHTFDSALVAYGIILAKYKYKKWHTGLPILFFILAVLSHGFYDYWLMFKGARPYGRYVTYSFYFLSISIYSTMLTNAINNSKFFSYKKIVESKKVAKRLFIYFGILFLLDGISAAIEFEYFFIFFAQLFLDFYKPGIFIGIVVLRLSRFTLIEGKWNPIKLEFPFRIKGSEGRGTMLRIQVKGEGYDETRINQYYYEYVDVSPLSSNSKFLIHHRKAFVEKKIFLQHDKSYYLVRFYMNDTSDDFVYFLLKPKTTGRTQTKSGHPIAGLFIVEPHHDLSQNNLSTKDFQFKEWVYVHTPI